MSVDKIILFTIFVSFIVFKHVQTEISHDITVEQLIGQWHTLATMDPTFHEHTNICNIKTITQGETNHTIKVVDEIGINETIYTYKALGKIRNSQLNLVYSVGNEVHEETSYVAIYDNGKGLILHDKENEKRRFMWQEISNATNLKETKAEFEKLSVKLGLEILYFDQEHCD